MRTQSTDTVRDRHRTGPRTGQIHREGARRSGMDILSPAERTYAWGSRVALPQLSGEPTPAPYPIAERWFGAHPTGPASIDGVGLDEIISADPIRALGDELAQAYEDTLPFMVKLLAADRALSLQAHPSRAIATEGYDHENSLGIAVDAPNRNYRDRNHKPELIVALSPFRALAGFRPPEDTIRILDVIGSERLRPYRDMLDAQRDDEGLRAIFTSFITLPRNSAAELVEEIVSRLVRMLADGSVPEHMLSECKGILELSEQYPGDSGVLGALLLNLVELAPGEGLYLGEGSLHAYLSGTGIEIMANSDNVLRGGLTSKHIDVPELLRVLDFSPLARPVVTTSPEFPPSAEPADALEVERYPTPAEEFHVSRIRAVSDCRVELHDSGPQIIVCTHGRAGDLAAGAGAWIAAEASAGSLDMTAGSEIFRIRAASMQRA